MFLTYVFCKQIQSSGYLTLPNRISQAPKKTHHPPLSLRRAESEQAQNRRTESARLVGERWRVLQADSL